MGELRQQLSLYVPREAAQALEEVRALVDPIQHRLIPAHVTLCREDELGDVSSLRDRLRALPFGPLTLSFGAPEVFSGHGLLLNAAFRMDRPWKDFGPWLRRLKRLGFPNGIEHARHEAAQYGLQPPAKSKR